MASIVKVEGKSGTSYRIFVTSGRTQDGGQVRHTKTWKVPAGMTEKKAEKEAKRIAYEFEEEIGKGILADNRQTLAEYSAYVFGLKERTGIKQSTLERYRELMRRITPALGHLKLREITPRHLNEFYANLAEEGIRDADQKATPKKDLKKLLKEKKLTLAALSRQTGMAASTFAPAVRGRTVSKRTADVLAEALGAKTESLFTLSCDTRPLSPKTITEYHRLLSTIFSQALKERLVSYNPASLASPPKLNRKEVESFQPEEIEQILEAAEKEPVKWRTILHLLIVTGCRRGEIAGLKWDAIDWDSNRLRISETLLYSPEAGIYADTTKTNEIRYLTVPEETMELLKSYRAWHDGLRLKNGDRWVETGYVFTRDNGDLMNPDNITQWCADFSRKYGLPPIHPHKFRHTAASLLIDRNMPITAVSKRLGHKSTSTTLNIYSHAVQRADGAAADLIADTFLRKPKQQKQASGDQS